MTLYERIHPSVKLAERSKIREYVRARTFNAQLAELSATCKLLSVTLKINDDGWSNVRINKLELSKNATYSRIHSSV